LDKFLAFAFGVVFLATILWLAFHNGDMTAPQFEILRSVLAIAGGGATAVIPGFLDINLRSEKKLALRAGGALAVFVILYFWSPAHWATPHEKTGSSINAPNGIAAETINNSTITVDNGPTSEAGSAPKVPPK
jgi:hypothetical protein